MSLPLSTAALAHLETATRALLSPLAFEHVDDWRRAVNAEFGKLMGGQHTLFRLPTGDGGHFTDDGGELVDSLMAFAHEVTPDMITYWDEAPNVWHTDRRGLGIEAFSWDIVTEVVRRGGLDVHRAPVWNEVFFRNGVYDYAGLITTRPEGDAILWSLGPRLSTTDGAQLSLLRVLAPAFRAGLDALDRLATHRTALDALSEPLAAFDADAREVFRNTALTDLVAADPEASHLEAALRSFATRLRPLAFARRTDSPAPHTITTRVSTARASYLLRAVLLAHGALGQGDAFLVTVEARGVAVTLPAPETLRQAFGLTKREAEVALLVAEGHANDEIAERLFVSSHTVRHHIESAMAKLDITGRGRAAVAARLLMAASF